MNDDLPIRAGRRREAIERLRTITTSALVAGAAGTIGFGFAAAATFRGTSTAAAATSGSDGATTPSTVGPLATPNPRNGTTTDPGTQGFGLAPNPRPAGGRQGHAATGGSG
jgi:hypothetical protein